MFKKKLADGLTQVGINATDEVLLKFMRYTDVMLEWNRRFNLTRITDEDEIITKHYLDSCIPHSLIPQNARLIDVGSGAGFPGIPLKIIRNDIKVLLLDSLNKRVTFLDEVIRELGLERAVAIHGRAEEVANDYRERLDVCVSRAVTNMGLLSEWCLPFLGLGGLFVAYKSSNATDEINDARHIIGILGGKIQEIADVPLPGTDIIRKIVIIEKVRVTPRSFPRRGKA